MAQYSVLGHNMSLMQKLDAARSEMEWKEAHSPKHNGLHRSGTSPVFAGHPAHHDHAHHAAGRHVHQKHHPAAPHEAGSPGGLGARPSGGPEALPETEADASVQGSGHARPPLWGSGGVGASIDAHIRTPNGSERRDGNGGPQSHEQFLAKIEQCEDMLHQWLVTHHRQPRKSQCTAVLVVRFHEQSSTSGSEPEADFFFDGDIQGHGEQGDRDGESAAGNAQKNAVLQAKEFFDRGGVLHLSDAEVQLAEQLRAKSAWVDEMVGRIEATMKELQQREARSFQKETMITNKYKELRAAMLRAEGFEFQLRQQALDLQTRERVLFEQEEECKVSQLAEDSVVSHMGSLQLVASHISVPSLSSSWNGLESHLDPGDANRSVSQSDLTLQFKLEAAAAVQSELENEIHRLKCERKSLVLRIEEISQHVAQQEESLSSLASPLDANVTHQEQAAAATGADIAVVAPGGGGGDDNGMEEPLKQLLAEEKSAHALLQAECATLQSTLEELARQKLDADEQYQQEIAAFRRKFEEDIAALKLANEQVTAVQQSTSPRDAAVRELEAGPLQLEHHFVGRLRSELQELKTKAIAQQPLSDDALKSLALVLVKLAILPSQNSQLDVKLQALDLPPKQPTSSSSPPPNQKQTKATPTSPPPLSNASATISASVLAKSEPGITTAPPVTHSTAAARSGSSGSAAISAACSGEAAQGEGTNTVNTNGTDTGNTSSTSASSSAAPAASALAPATKSGTGADSSEASRVKPKTLDSSGSLWAAAKAERARKLASR